MNSSAYFCLWKHTIHLLVLPTVLLFGCGKESTPDEPIIRPVKAFKVGEVSELNKQSFPGRARAIQEVDLSFRVEGTLLELPKDIVGRTYKKGQVISRLDPRDFEVALENAQGRLDRAQAAFKRAQADYGRVLRIQKQDPGATSQAEVDRKRQQRDNARADIRTYRAAVAAAKDKLGYTQLKAPFDGTIVSQYVQNFEDVRAKQQVVRLLDQSKVEMVVSIPERFISYTSSIEKVWVRFDTFPNLEIPAKVKEIGTEASATTRTYPVTLIMDQPEGAKILPGMAGKTLKAEGLPQSMSAPRILVPVSATVSPKEGGKTYVWVIDEASKTAKRREVAAGQITNRGVVIEKGLKAGEWVATAGVHSLREGQKVSILQE